MKVYILRGISGVGKSTFANYLKRTEEEVLVCSADDMMDHGYGYQFNGAVKVEDAHKYCLRAFIDGVQKRWPVIVLDNTNLLYHKFQHYIVIAEAFDYEIEIVTIAADPEAIEGRNKHGVDLNSLRRMAKRLKDDQSRVDIPVKFRQRTIPVGSSTWERWSR